MTEHTATATEGARVLYGLKGTEWTIDSLQKIPLPEYRPLLDHALKDLIAGKSGYHVEFKIRRPTDGAILDILSIAEYDPVRNVVLGVIRDITERKKSEAVLRETENRIRESEEFLRTVITGAKEGIIVFDRGLRITLWNRFMEDMTGMKTADVIGKKPFEIFPFIREQGLDILLNKALSGTTSESPDIRFSFPSTGKTGWSKGIFSPNYDSHGSIIGVVEIVRDITARKDAEDALRESEGPVPLPHPELLRYYPDS